MPEKITYEEILIEKLTKAFKDVVEQISEDDLWSGTPNQTSPMHEGKGDSDIQKVTRPKAEKVSEKNPVGGDLVHKQNDDDKYREPSMTGRPGEKLEWVINSCPKCKGSGKIRELVPVRDKGHNA